LTELLKFSSEFRPGLFDVLT